MKLITHEICLEPEEPFHIVPFSDVHLDSRDCAREDFLADYKRFSKLHNVRFHNYGDFCNLVMAKDMKRHTPSTPDKRYAESDEYVNRLLTDVDEVLETVPDAKWDCWGMGNHEYSAIKFHHVNIPRLIAERRKYELGGYSGRVWYKIRPKNKSTTFKTLRTIYHHGAWGGQIIKGYGGAYRFFMPMGSWDLAFYGHNHAEQIRPEAFWDVDDAGRNTVKKRYIVNTGTYLKGLSRDDVPDYGELAGYPITTIGCPLVKIWTERVRTGGADNWRLHWEVTSKGGVNA